MRFFKRKAQRENKKDITNPKLVKAISAVSKNDNPETRKILYEAFLTSTFIIPIYGEIEGGPDDEWRTLPHPAPVNFICGKDNQGQPLMYIFTDVDSLLAWDPQGCRYMGMHARGTFQLALNNNFASIIVNPGGLVGGFLTRGEIEDLAAGKIPK